MAKRATGRSFLRFEWRKLFTRKLIGGMISALPYALSAGFIAVLFTASYGFAMQSDLFALRRVSLADGRVLTPQAAAEFAGLRLGERMLSLDLARIERRITARNPEFRDVRIRRILPDEIEISLKRRVALAQIESGAFYLVDAEGMLISGPSAQPVGDLPVIRGVRVQKRDLRKGARLDRYALSQGMQLLKDIRKYDVLRGNRLTALDISNPNNFVIWVNGTIEMRIAARNFASQLKKVSEALAADLKLDPERIQYVDLRFDDVVIGYR